MNENTRPERRAHVGTVAQAEINRLTVEVARLSATVARTAMHTAADYIDAKAAKYLQENAETEHDTGATVFQFGEAGRDYHSGLVELAEELRAVDKVAHAIGQMHQSTGMRCPICYVHPGEPHTPECTETGLA